MDVGVLHGRKMLEELMLGTDLQVRNMCIDMCIAMCIDMCIDMYIDRHVHRHVIRRLLLLCPNLCLLEPTNVTIHMLRANSVCLGGDASVSGGAIVHGCR